MANTGDFEKSLDAAVEKLEAIMLRNLNMAGDLVANAAKDKVGVDSGALKADIRSEVENNGDQAKAVIGNSLDYAIYHHQGTGIYATDGSGRKTPWVYTDPKTGEKVWTQGSRPNPYLQDAVLENQGNIEKLLGGM